MIKEHKSSTSTRDQAHILFKVISLEGEEEDKVSFVGNMKTKGAEIAAGCLVGKILTTRGVSIEGLRAAMHQVWRTIRRVRIENLGENVFLFKFALKADKRRVALLVLIKPTGIGNIAKQAFTHVSFWVQILNVPIMAMNTDTISRLGAIIGIVEEVETGENGKCIGEYARVRIKVDISKPLKKIIFLEPEGKEKIPMPIRYERLPDFCFCCGTLGHQFREYSGNGLETTRIEVGGATTPMSKSHMAEMGAETLMLEGAKLMEQQMLGNVKKEAGGKWREMENTKESQSLGLMGLKNKAQTISTEGEVTAKKKPKSKKLKHLARDTCSKDENKMGSLVKKWPRGEAEKRYPEAKKLKMSSSVERAVAQDGVFFLATLNASVNSEASDMEEMKVIGSIIEEILAEAEGQPRWEP
ncbi:CCHC-type domain-containing protein [Citrus sinensis]|nr:CCHC-type domain-containing protein [Citrus sinensis]